MKVYGKVINTWKHLEERNYHGENREVECISQYEVAYKEYDADGDKVAIGTEDFSRERYNNLKYYRIFTWDGEKYNKGGNRWFEESLMVKIDRKDRKILKELAAIWFPNAAAIDIR